VQWSTDVLDELIPEIWKSNASVVKVHCHPTGFDRFSAIDDLSDGELALSFEGLFDEGRMHGSLVLLPDGRIFGRTLQDGKIGDDLGLIFVAGNNIDLWSRRSVRERDDDKRTQQAFGPGTVKVLNSLQVAVIGCSGTGSVVIEQLARLGVGGFVLVDPDHVEHKNLNRILNATFEDAEQGIAKVDVCRRTIESLGRGQLVLSQEKSASARWAFGASKTRIIPGDTGNSARTAKCGNFSTGRLSPRRAYAPSAMKS
jgi:hypothetical protein